MSASEAYLRRLFTGTLPDDVVTIEITAYKCRPDVYDSTVVGVLVDDALGLSAGASVEISLEEYYREAHLMLDDLKEGSRYERYQFEPVDVGSRVTFTNCELKGTIIYASGYDIETIERPSSGCRP